MSYHQTIYDRLRQHGITEAGALGILGNFECESNCEPFRLQGDFSAYRTNSHAYVQGVTCGRISRETFSRDAKGFGIYQLTYWTRKQGYYDFWKQSGKELDDAALQVDYAVREMQSDYPQLLTFLKQTADTYTACSRVCREFERPAVNNIDARYQAALKIRKEIDINGWSSEASSSENPNSSQAEDATENATVTATEYWPPRTVDKNMTGADVEVLQAVLKARGYIATNPDGIFGSYLEDAVRKFQSASGLVADGIVGPLTWGKLLER